MFPSQVPEQEDPAQQSRRDRLFVESSVLNC